MAQRPSILSAAMPSWMRNIPQAPQGIGKLPTAPVVDQATQLYDDSLMIGKNLRKRRRRAGILSTLGAGETGGILGAAMGARTTLGV